MWPRLSQRRGPRSCGSRRQMRALYAAAPRTSSGRPASSSVLIRSASPWRRSRSGSVASSASSITTRAGQWNAPTRFLPCGDVDRRLAADPRVDLSDERRRHRDPRDAAEVGRGGEAGQVGRRAAAERDDGPVAVERQLAPESFDHGQLLRRLAGGQLVRGDEPVAERVCAAGRRGCPSPSSRRRARPGRRPARARRGARATPARGGRPPRRAPRRRRPRSRRSRRPSRGRAAPVRRTGGETPLRPARGVGRCPRSAARPCRHRRRAATVNALRASASRTVGVLTAPPPRSSTDGSPLRARRTSAASTHAKLLLALRGEDLPTAAGCALDHRRPRRTCVRAARRPRARSSSCPRP